MLIFLFHAGGYYAVFLAFYYHAENTLVQQADAGQYTASDEVILSISMSLPYPVHAGEYTSRSPQSFEYEGEYYTVVRQKVDGDQVQLVCVRNVRQGKLKLAMTDYSKTVNNQPVGRALHVIAKFFKDYQPATDLTISDVLTGLSIPLPQTPICLAWPDAPCAIFSPPPEKQL